MPAREPGTRVRLLETYGNVGDHPGAGWGPAPLHAGWEGVVREVVPADVRGAHNDREDAVVVEFSHDAPVEVMLDPAEVQLAAGDRVLDALDPDTGERVPRIFRLVQGKAKRATAFSFADFDRLFEEVSA